MKTGIIIQARMGSIRLPGKVLKDFHKGDTILDLILRRLLACYKQDEIIVATTCLEEDDQLVSHIKRQYKVNVFRGANKDVLYRFIDASGFYGLDSIVRVCADNPFLDIESIDNIILTLNKGFDYVGFKLPNNIPAIKSHLGLFAEGVKVAALKKICRYTNDEAYHEHVTAFLYSHPDIFSIKFLNLPEYLLTDAQLFRFTVDTIEDFKLLQSIYQRLIGKSKTKILNNRKLIKATKSDPDILSVMKRQILLNAK